METQAPLGKSDHSMLVFDYNCYVDKCMTKRRLFLYDKGDYLRMKEEFTECWIEEVKELTDIEEKWKAIKNKIKESERLCIPSRIHTVSVIPKKVYITKLDNKTRIAKRRKNKLE